MGVTLTRLLSANADRPLPRHHTLDARTVATSRVGSMADAVHLRC
jgi:hypothetical protein